MAQEWKNSGMERSMGEWAALDGEEERYRVGNGKKEEKKNQKGTELTHEVSHSNVSSCYT